jgi:hypothetical protein
MIDERMTMIEKRCFRFSFRRNAAVFFVDRVGFLLCVLQKCLGFQGCLALYLERCTMVEGK